MTENEKRKEKLFSRIWSKIKKPLTSAIIILIFFGGIYFIDDFLPQTQITSETLKKTTKKATDFFQDTWSETWTNIKDLKPKKKEKKTEVAKKSKTTKKTTPARKPVARKFAQQQTKVQKSPEVRKLEAEVARLRKEKKAILERAERKRQLTAKIHIPRADYIPVPRAEYIPVPGRMPRYYQERTNSYQRELVKGVAIMVLFGILGQHGHGYQSNRFIFPGQTQYGNSISKRQLKK